MTDRTPPMTISTKNILAVMETPLGERAMKAYDTVLAYPDTIERMEAQARLISFKYDGEEFRDAMERLDTNRRSKHDAAMASLSMMNRICEKEGIEPVTDPVDFSHLHRSEVGDAICEHVKEVLDNDRYHKALDKAKEHLRRPLPDISGIKRADGTTYEMEAG